MEYAGHADAIADADDEADDDANAGANAAEEPVSEIFNQTVLTIVPSRTEETTLGLAAVFTYLPAREYIRAAVFTVVPTL